MFRFKFFRTRFFVCALFTLTMAKMANADGSVEEQIRESSNKFETVLNAATREVSADLSVLFDWHPHHKLNLGRSYVGLCFSSNNPNTSYTAIISAAEVSKGNVVVEKQFAVRQQDTPNEFSNIDRRLITSPFGLEWILWAKEARPQFTIASESPLVVISNKGTRRQISLNFTKDENYLYLTQMARNRSVIQKTCVFARTGY